MKIDVREMGSEDVNLIDMAYYIQMVDFCVDSYELPGSITTWSFLII